MELNQTLSSNEDQRKRRLSTDSAQSEGLAASSDEEGAKRLEPLEGRIQIDRAWLRAELEKEETSRQSRRPLVPGGGEGGANTPASVRSSRVRS